MMTVYLISLACRQHHKHYSYYRTVMGNPFPLTVCLIVTPNRPCGSRGKVQTMRYSKALELWRLYTFIGNRIFIHSL